MSAGPEDVVGRPGAPFACQWIQEEVIWWRD